MYKINFFEHNWLPRYLHNEIFKKNIDVIHGRVIDMGCGTAPYKSDILKIAKEYIGVDWSNSQHDCKADIVADLSKPINIESNSADTIISFQVLEHLPEPRLFLSECFRIIKPGGFIFLTVPFQWHIHEAPFDYYRFTKYGLNYIFNDSGFEDIYIEEIGCFWYTWLLKLNYFLIYKFPNGIFRYLLLPITLTNQLVALLLDKIITRKQEAGGYSVIAQKKK